MANLAHAIALAATKHMHQKDRSGKPYILHPLTVMNILVQQGHGNDEHVLILAVLHDLLEDTNYTVEQLRHNGYSEEIIEDLMILNKQKGDDYEKTYIPRAGSKYRTALVKRADLITNSDILRLKGVSEKDMQRMAKYHRSFVYINERIKEFEQCVFNKA